jgi:hypothetical protein
MTKSFLSDELSMYNEYLKQLGREEYFGGYNNFDWSEQKEITKLLFQKALPTKLLN